MFLYQIIGIIPHDISYYKAAFLHKSVARRNAKGKSINDERLEFLGNVILDAIVGDIVYEHFPGKREDFLTNTRSKIVQHDALDRLTKGMGIGQSILSNGQASSYNDYLGGDAFEALVGALYPDHGYNACMKFIKQQVLGKLINIDRVAYKEVNFKSKLIEQSQKNKVNIEFKLIENQRDKQGSPTFHFQVIVEDIPCGEGHGYSKRESQQEASKLTLQRLCREPQFINEIFAARIDRTRMEEEPVLNVPETLQDTNFIEGSESKVEKHENLSQAEVFGEKSSAVDEVKEELTDSSVEEEKKASNEDFGPSDISRSKSIDREAIIAAAEAEAFRN